MNGLLIVALLSFSIPPFALSLSKGRSAPSVPRQATLRQAQGERRLRHGTWVYRINGKALTDASALRSFARDQGLDEVYLSLGAAPLKDLHTPGVIQALREGGLHVEALLEGPGASKAVDDVIAFNHAHFEAERYQGIHYDVEPWQKTGEDNSWAAPLADEYRSARARAERAGLTFNADISGVKFFHLAPATQDALLAAASHLVLMAYQASEETVHRRYEAWLGRAQRQAGTVMIALRAKDFCNHGKALRTLDERYGDKEGYGGWATFSFNEHLDPAPCRGVDGG